MVAEPLSALADRYQICCVAVGADPDQLKGTPFKAVDWSEGKEAELVSSFDVGIMPLESTQWELGKCAYKIIQYMAAGVPVVASPVGMNVEVIERTGSGVFANSSEEWCAEIEQLIRSPELRATRGMRGRTAVEDFYSVQAQAPRLATMWREVVLSHGEKAP
ncbi:glycosyltransferase [Luteimonas dalianensis]